MSKIYEKEYLAEIAETFDEVDKRVLLWTNPNPTASFAPQAVSIGLSNYDAVEVLAKKTATEPYHFYSKAPIGTTGNACVIEGGVTFDRNYVVSETGITFQGGGYAMPNGSFVADNTRSVPIEIYGIQFGASAGDGSSGGTMNYPDLLHKPTINGVTLVEGLVTEDLNLGDTAHEEITQAEFNALTPEERDDGTVYFVKDGIMGNVFLDDNTPIGTIAPFGGTSDPSYWLICDGRAVSRTDYAALFGVIGTTYGAGDGSTTFNIPDLRGRTAQGAGTLGDETYTLGDSVDAGLPNITGSKRMGWPDASGPDTIMQPDGSGAFGTVVTGTSQFSPPSASGTYNNTLTFDASNSNSIYGNSSTVQPNAVVTNYIIKYASTVSEHQANIDFYYPVGSYYETSNANFDPNVTWGGTWVSDGAVDDYIVAEGTEDIWTYRKWASGIAECWGTWGGTLSHYGTSFGGYAYYTTVNFPSGLFISTPVTTYSGQVDSSFALTGTQLTNSKDATNCYAISGASGSQPVLFILNCKGKWKDLDINTKYEWHRTA